MGIVVLDPEQRDIAPGGNFLSDLRGIVFRVQITDDSLGSDLQKLFHTPDRLFERAHRAKVFKVPYIGRQVQQIPGGYTEGIFQFSSDCQNAAIEDCGIGRIGRIAQIPACPVVFTRIEHRKRSIAAGTAYHIWMSSVEVHYGIISPDSDQAVVAQDTIAKAGQFGQRILVIPADRSSRYISACHDQAVRHLQTVVIIKEQKLKRRIGKHDTDLGIAGRHGRRQFVFQKRIKRIPFFSVFPLMIRFLSFYIPVKEQDRFLMSRQDLPLFFIKQAFPAHCLLVLHHNRERFGRTAFTLAQPVDCLFICGIAAQMESADPLDRNDSSGQDDLPGGSDRLPAPDLFLSRSLSRFIRSRQQVDLGSAFVTADRLGVISSGKRTVIFLRAGSAHRKHFHTGALPVIGKRVEYGQTRPAACAINKWMQISAVVRVI